MDSYYEQDPYSITDNFKNSVKVKDIKGKVHIRKKAHVKHYFEKPYHNLPLIPQHIETDHDNLENDFITLFVETSDENNENNTMWIQSDETIPYDLESDEDISNDLQSLFEQPTNYTTRSGRIIRVPEHFKNFTL